MKHWNKKEIGEVKFGCKPAPPLTQAEIAGFTMCCTITGFGVLLVFLVLSGLFFYAIIALLLPFLALGVMVSVDV